MMTYEEFYLESTRRGFLKQIGGALASNVVPGAKKLVKSVTNPTASVASGLKKFKCVAVSGSRGDWEVGYVWDAVGKSVADIVDRTTQNLRDNDYEVWLADDPEYSTEEYYEDEFIGGGKADENIGLGELGSDEVSTIYVVREDNPLFNLLKGIQKGWPDLSTDAYKILKQGIESWEFGDWGEFVQDVDKFEKAEAENRLVDKEAEIAKHEAEIEKARKQGEAWMRARQPINVTMPRHIAQALLDALKAALNK